MRGGGRRPGNEAKISCTQGEEVVSCPAVIRQSGKITSGCIVPYFWGGSLKNSGMLEPPNQIASLTINARNHMIVT